MIKYPLDFYSRSQSESGIQNKWSATSSENHLNCSIPIEFEGPGGALSPEDLYIQALSNCFIATFKVYAEHSKLTFGKLETESKLTVDINENKKPVMKSFLLKIKLSQPSSPEKAQLLVKKAFENGFVLNSVKTDLKYELEIA